MAFLTKLFSLQHTYTAYYAIKSKEAIKTESGYANSPVLALITILSS